MKKPFHAPFIALLTCMLALPACTAPEDAPPIAGLTAWYRADKVETDADKKVKSWPSGVGEANSLAPADVAPVLVSDAANGKPSVRFADGASLLNPDFNWSEKGYTVFVVASMADAPEKPQYHINHRTVTTKGEALISDLGRLSSAYGITWTGRPGALAGVPANAPLYEDFEAPYAYPESSDLLVQPGKFYVYAFASEQGKDNSTRTGQGATVSFRTFVNGVESSDPSKKDLNLERQFSGNGLQLANSGADEKFKGDIAEVLVFDHQLKDDERSKVFVYLSARYGLKEPVPHLAAEPVRFSPAFDNTEFYFDKEVAVKLQTPTVGANIHYTLDGSEPKASSPIYSEPIKLTKTTVVKAAAFAKGRDSSPVLAATYNLYQPAPKTANKLESGWKYSWGDEFNGPEINRKLWTFEKGYLRNAEIQYFTDRKENVRIDNGNLLIQGLHDNWEGNAYTAASLITADNVKLTYGRYEMRGKIDIRTGSWPAWWMFAAPGYHWPADGEIDMMEYYMGKVNTNIMDGKGGWYGGNKRTSMAKFGGVEWAKNFHTWTMDWTPDSIKMYIDGRLKVDYPVKEADGGGPNGTNPFRSPETKMMVLNQSLGGTWGGEVHPEDAPFEFRVDYMRVHQWAKEPAYTLTVKGGAGTGPYVVGSPASIEANMAPDGYVFDHWASNVPIPTPNNSVIRLAMPASDVTITALYKPAPK